MTSTPRALILDLFGDYLRYVDGEAKLGQLTTLLGAFDVAPAAVRVTLSRLRREGWFTTRREGRETVYTLAADMLDVLEDGRRRIFASPPESWAGEWTMVIYRLSEDDRQQREQLRRDLAWHGFGMLSTSTWLAPGDRREAITPAVSAFADEQVDVLRCTSSGLAEDRRLAGRCWDLAALARDYDRFVADNRDLGRRASRLRGEAALVARTELIATYRHFPFKDPQLPPELRPSGWPGVEAERLFRRVHERLGPAARAYVGDVVGRAVPAG